MIVIAVVGEMEDRVSFLKAIREKYMPASSGLEKANLMIPGLNIVTTKIAGQDIQLRFITSAARSENVLKQQMDMANAIIHISKGRGETLKAHLSRYEYKVYELASEPSLDKLFSTIVTNYEKLSEEQIKPHKPEPINITKQFEIGFWGEREAVKGMDKDKKLLEHINRVTELPEGFPEVRSKVILFELQTIAKLSINDKEKSSIAREKMLDFYTKLTKEDALVLIPKLEKLKDNADFKFLNKQITTPWNEVKTTLQAIIDNVKEATKETSVSYTPPSLK